MEAVPCSAGGFPEGDGPARLKRVHYAAPYHIIFRMVPDMAKKVTGYIKLQIPAGKATPAPRLVLLLDSTVLISLNLPSSSMQEQQIREINHPCCNYCLRRQKLQLCNKDSACCSTAEESMQSEVRFRCAEQDQSCNYLQGQG